jgi:alpha-L-fucosidase
MLIPLVLLPFVARAQSSDVPAVPPIPSASQQAWHTMEFYGFLHFSINTFTGKEWGYGDESPALFNPSDFDAGEIARIAAEAGMKGLILTCKHHDGFCLWPSACTEHSVRNSPWKEGRGDVVRDISDACRRQGLKFGIYLSPWDRNHPDYGKPEYVRYYSLQLRELLTNYGEISEVWFDGANGGDGYYGGAREVRQIDRTTYYGWDSLWAIVRELQPDAVIFSDVGPDVRWVGNEGGIAGETCWAMYTPFAEDGGPASPGNIRMDAAQTGQEDGRFWIPAECDVSIRPGWFFRDSENAAVKRPHELFSLYLRSVGRNASLLLNIPPDRRGRIHDADKQSLLAFGMIIREAFVHDLASGAAVTGEPDASERTSSVPGNLFDADPRTYWSPADLSDNWSLNVMLGQPEKFNCILLQEPIALGQRVERFQVERWWGGRWSAIAYGTTIGHKRILTFLPVTAQKIRVTLTSREGPPLLSTLSLYLLPDTLLGDFR